MEEYQDIKDSLFYAIDVSPSMLEPLEQDKTKNPALAALQAVCEAARTHMVETPANNIGLLFYGVKGHKQNIYEFMPLGPQNSDSIKELMRLCDDPDFFKEKITPSTEKTNIADVFFQAGVQFERDKAKSFRRLVIVTNSDLPCEPALAPGAITVSRDLTNKNVFILPVFIKTPGKEFNVDLFWGDIHYGNSDSKFAPRTIGMDSLKAMIVARSHIKRSLFRVPLQFGAISMDVKGYNLVGSQRKPPTPRRVYVEGTKETIVQGTTQFLNANTGAEVSKDEMTRAFGIGDATVEISESEMEELRNFGDPKIFVLAATNRLNCAMVQTYGHSYFLYPSDTQHTGSTRAFAALYHSLIRRDKVLIASALVRKNSVPFICLLIPSIEKKFDKQPDIQERPPGIHMVRLPFVDDIRKIPPGYDVKNRDDPPDEIQGLIEKVATTLTWKPNGYSPYRFPNPKLEWYDSIIEATALSEEMPPAPRDPTIPKYSSFEKRVGSELREISRLLATPESDDEPAAQKTRLE